MTLRIWLFFLFLSLSSFLRAEDFQIGYVTESPAEVNNTYLQKSIEKIASALGTKVRLIPMSEETFKSAVEYNEVNAFLIPSLFYRQLPSKGLRDIVVLSSSKSSHPNYTVGVSFFFNADGFVPKTLNDLQGRSIGMLSNNLSAHKIFKGMLVRHGINYVEFSRLIRYSDSLKSLLEELHEGKISAVVLPACLLEDQADSLQASTSWLLPLGGKIHPSMACVHSSDLFPGMVFGVTPMITAAQLSAISRALLEMPPSRNGEKWKVATDFRGVDRLLRSIDLDEDAAMRKPSIQRFLTMYWEYFFIAFSIFFLVLFSSIALSWLVKRRTSELNNALITQKALEEEAMLVQLRLEKMQKLGAVGQMSSLFAHEIRQPLNAILCYAFTLERIIRKQPEQIKDSEEALRCVFQIQTQSERVDQIVEKVRAYLKERKVNRQKIHLQEILKSAESSFKTTAPAKGGYAINFSLPSKPIYVFADPLDIELVLINLFRNSIQIPNSKKKIIKVHLHEESGLAVLSIADNGPEISDEELQKIRYFQSSSKPGGLGLGLSIVNFLVENHGGTMAVGKNKPTGFLVNIRLPICGA